MKDKTRHGRKPVNSNEKNIPKTIKITFHDGINLTIRDVTSTLQNVGDGRLEDEEVDPDAEAQVPDQGRGLQRGLQRGEGRVHRNAVLLIDERLDLSCQI